MLNDDNQTPAPDESEQADFTPETPAPQAPVVEPEVPDKFKGKSLTDIVEMYWNVESELGRARNEIGTVRQLADELLGVRRATSQAAPAKPVERKKLTADDLLSDPNESVLGVVRAEVAEREQSLAARQAALESQFALQVFERKHPDYRSTMQDQKFSEWVQKSPLRVSLARASMDGNYQAADELFTLYSEMALAAPAERAPVDPVEQARKATLVRPGAASTAGGGKSADAGKKVWKRAELMTMRINNPDQFDALQPEILQAYREKRVK